MPVITEFSEGTPCWFELATTGQEAAKKFYSEMFGWSVLDTPMGPGEAYTMFTLKGQTVAAAYTLPPKLREQGVPPHWNVYFTAKDVEAATAKVPALGGSVVQPPFDVMEAGRMSICKDAGGAIFSLWQGKGTKGVGLMGENNAVCWSELATWDTKQAAAFYANLFGWQIKDSQPIYVEFSTAGEPRGGLLQMDDKWQGAPSHWGIYVMVADCDATVAKLLQLGGKTCKPAFDAAGVGRMAVVEDPQGAKFCLITLKRG